MQTRPKLLIAISMAMVAVALSLPIQISFLFGHPFTEVEPILAKLTPLNWAVMGVCLLHGYCVFNASRWMLASTILAVLVVNFNNIAVGSIELNYSFGQAFLGTLGFIALNGALAHPSIRNLVAMPSKRWWMRAPRRSIKLNMSVKRLNGEVFMAHTHDISRGGAFIPFFSVEEYSRGLVHPPLVPNDLEHVMLDFMVNDKPYSCQAKVVRKTDASGTYPAGLGLQFVNLSGKEQRQLDRYLRNVPDTTQQPEITL